MNKTRWRWLATAAQFNQMIKDAGGEAVADVYCKSFGEQDVVMHVSRSDRLNSGIDIGRCCTATGRERAGRSTELIDIRGVKGAPGILRVVQDVGDKSDAAGHTIRR